MVKKIASVLGILLVVVGVAGLRYWQGQQLVATEKEAAAKLKEMKALVGMDATRTSVATVTLVTISDPEIRKSAIALLPKLYRLTSLDIRQIPLTEEHLKAIAKCRKLQSLNLNECTLEDSAVKHLFRLKELQALYLTQTPITQAALPTIQNLSQLKILDLSETRVTGGLDPLSGIPQLEWLLLRSLQLQPKSLSALAKCKKLTRLSLAGTKVAADEISALKGQIAGLAVDESE